MMNNSAMMQTLTDAEFNIQWVFNQLLSMPLPEDDANRPSTSAMLKKRNSLDGSNGNDHTQQGCLTAAHIRHILSFLHVTISPDEAEEVMHLLDENGDNKVTIEDFFATMKVTNSTPFDSRYAVNLPFQALDSNKDGLLTDNDFRVAREKLGKCFACDNDQEFHQIMRTLHSSAPQQQQPNSLAAAPSSSGGSGDLSSAYGSSKKCPPHVDKEVFKRVVGTIVLSEPATAIGKPDNTRAYASLASNIHAKESSHPPLQRLASSTHQHHTTPASQTSHHTTAAHPHPNLNIHPTHPHSHPQHHGHPHAHHPPHAIDRVKSHHPAPHTSPKQTTHKLSVQGEDDADVTPPMVISVISASPQLRAASATAVATNFALSHTEKMQPPMEDNFSLAGGASFDSKSQKSTNSSAGSPKASRSPSPPSLAPRPPNSVKTNQATGRKGSKSSSTADAKRKKAAK